MDSGKEIYADGIGQIHFAGGMVRYDFVNLEPGQDEPAFESRARIIMPPQGFLNMFNSMQELINKLLEAGVLQRNVPQARGNAMPVAEDALVIDDEKALDLIDPQEKAVPKKKAAKKLKK